MKKRKSALRPIICAHCKMPGSTYSKNGRFCSDKCYARAYQKRRRVQIKENLTPSMPYARSKVEEWYAEILIPLGYLMNKVVVKGHYVGKGHFRYYTLDFALLENKINIEIDGPTHKYSQEKDRKRDEFLRSHEWKVIRVLHYRKPWVSQPLKFRDSPLRLT